MEFALAIPLLATVIVLTFFFGFAMVNQQQVKASSRYLAWRAIGRDYRLSGGELSGRFFKGRDVSITVSDDRGPQETLEDLVDKATRKYQPAGALIERCMDMEPPWPRGRRVGISAEFSSSVAAWKRFTGAIRSHHAREGVQWRRGEVSYLEPIRQEFLQSLDKVVSEIEPPLRASLEQLYVQKW